MNLIAALENILSQNVAGYVAFVMIPTHSLLARPFSCTLTKFELICNRKPFGLRPIYWHHCITRFIPIQFPKRRNMSADNPFKHIGYFVCHQVNQ